MTATHDPATIVDLDRYPLGDPAASSALAASLGARLRDEGVAVLPGFVRAEAVDRIVTESDALAPDGHHSRVTNTVYLSAPDDAFAPEHPRRRAVVSALRAVAADQIPATSPLWALYDWPVLREFIAAVLALDEIHPYADPLGKLNIAVMGPGDELGWHFDQTDFVTSIALRGAGGGGDFEVAADLRTADDERVEHVTAVLDGDRSAVRQWPFDPGTLMIFAGRRSLHRVTPISTEPARLVALLAYDSAPGTDSSERLKLVRYGRTA